MSFAIAVCGSEFIQFICNCRHKSFPEVIGNSSPQDLREDIKRLQIIQLQMKDAVQNMSQQRDSLIMEIQQLQEAKPVLEKAYAVRISVDGSARDSLIDKEKIVFFLTAIITSQFNAENTAIGNEKSPLAAVLETAATLHRITYES